MTKPFNISPQVFGILSAFIEEHSGVHYEPRDRDLFADKVAARASEVGFDSALDYYYYLRYDAAGGAELEALIDALVVNETYFYREADALRALVQNVLRPLIAKGERPRVWCAACSTGEEPLSLSLMLAEEGLLGSTRIVASDISGRVLGRAKAGEFRSRAFRALPSEVEHWFDMVSEPPRIRRSILDSVEWKRVNIVSPDEVLALGSFDAVLCRNVLIYFSDSTVLAVVESIAKVLKTGGHLLVGASESLLRFGTMLECQERGGSFFYVKASS